MAACGAHAVYPCECSGCVVCCSFTQMLLLPPHHQDIYLLPKARQTCLLRFVLWQCLPLACRSCSTLCILYVGRTLLLFHQLALLSDT